MSQAIGNIVYGIRCTKEMRRVLVDNGLVEDIFGSPQAGYEALGFTVDYHPSGDLMPIWCGVVLDSVSDGNDILFSKIKCEPTDEQRAEAVAKIAALPKVLRAMSGDPDVWLIWAGS